MAEAFMKEIAGNKIRAESAGLEPKELNPLVIEVMKEAGFDISAQTANSVFTYFKEGKLYNYVITLCGNSGFKQCPVFPGVTQRLHWPFPDPEKLTGTMQKNWRLSGIYVIRLGKR